MKTLASYLGLAALAHAAPPPAFFKALHQVETGGRAGAIVGDNGRALGPLQIHRPYHKDSKVAGDYTKVADYDYSVRVVSAYLKKYAPQAWERGDVVTLARIHNGGPRGASKPATEKYAAKVVAAMGGAQ
jgi:hypothetical protein